MAGINAPGPGGNNYLPMPTGARGPWRHTCNCGKVFLNILRHMHSQGYRCPSGYIHAMENTYLKGYRPLGAQMPPGVFCLRMFFKGHTTAPHVPLGADVLLRTPGL